MEKIILVIDDKEYIYEISEYRVLNLLRDLKQYSKKFREYQDAENTYIYKNDEIRIQINIYKSELIIEKNNKGLWSKIRLYCLIDLNEAKIKDILSDILMEDWFEPDMFDSIRKELNLILNKVNTMCKNVKFNINKEYDLIVSEENCLKILKEIQNNCYNDIILNFCKEEI